MNGYDILIKSLNDMLENKNNEEYDKADIKQQIAALQTVNGKSELEIDAIFGTGAFNEICVAYCMTAMKNCDISGEKCEEVKNELRWLFDTLSATQICGRV